MGWYRTHQWTEGRDMGRPGNFIRTNPPPPPSHHHHQSQYFTNIHHTACHISKLTSRFVWQNEAREWKIREREKTDNKIKQKETTKK
jgi:hypothetical protein